VLKVTPQLATLGTESMVYDCLLSITLHYYAKLGDKCSKLLHVNSGDDGTEPWHELVLHQLHKFDIV